MPALWIFLMAYLSPVYGRIDPSCSTLLLTSFTPCIDYITSSTAEGTSPSTDCCTSLNALTSTSMECLCLIVTGGVPLHVPINRTLAISLPRACNMPSVPVQCKGSAASVSSAAYPGPALLGKIAASPFGSPIGVIQPESDLPPSLSPSSFTEEGGAPSYSLSYTHPVLNPSSMVSSSDSTSASLLILAFGVSVMLAF